jgi:hypothetical protein
MTEKDALKAANEEEKKIYQQAKDKLLAEYSKDYKKKMGSDKNIPEELSQRFLKDDKRYQDALQRLRDSVIEDDMAESIERAMKDRHTDIPKKILKNHMDLKTTWEENGWANPGGKSTAQLVREMHYNNKYKPNLKAGEELHLNLSTLTPYEAGEKKKGKTLWTKFKGWSKTKHGKLAMGIVGGAAAVSALGYVGYKSGWLNPKFNEESKHISCIG